MYFKAEFTYNFIGNHEFSARYEGNEKNHKLLIPEKIYTISTSQLLVNWFLKNKSSCVYSSLFCRKPICYQRLGFTTTPKSTLYDLELDYVTSLCSSVTNSVFKDNHNSFSLHRGSVFPWPGIIKMVNSLLQRDQLLIVLYYLPILIRTSCPNICALYCIIYVPPYHLKTPTLAV